MKSKLRGLILAASVCFVVGFAPGWLQGNKENPKAEAPPSVVVEPEMDSNNFRVAHPEQFALSMATDYKAPSSLNVTGVVNPDIARAVPVISFASGRVVEIKARLGDEVKKGKLLLRVRSNDISDRLPGLFEGRE